jgi:hypothetical protein
LQRVENGRRRGVIRADHYVLTGPIVGALTDAEFRALLILWSWVARYGDDGEFERDSLGHILWSSKGGRRRRITPRMLARFIGLGLIEEHEYIDDGKQVLVIADWRSYGPVDLTSAERKRRYRRRKYGNGYYGTIGEVAEVVPAARLTREEFEEIAAIEAEGRAIIEALERDEEEVTAMVREGGRPARGARERASDSSTRARKDAP